MRRMDTGVTEVGKIELSGAVPGTSTTRGRREMLWRGCKKRPRKHRGRIQALSFLNVASPAASVEPPRGDQPPIFDFFAANAATKRFASSGLNVSDIALPLS